MKTLKAVIRSGVKEAQRTELGPDLDLKILELRIWDWLIELAGEPAIGAVGAMLDDVFCALTEMGHPLEPEERDVIRCLVMMHFLPFFVAKESLEVTRSGATNQPDDELCRGVPISVPSWAQLHATRSAKVMVKNVGGPESLVRPLAGMLACGVMDRALQERKIAQLHKQIVSLKKELRKKR